MFKSILSKVGWGELPSSFGFTIGEKVDLPFQWCWDLHKGQKRSDGSPVSIFICGKKDLDSAQTAAAKNAEQVSKSLRHPNVLRALDSIEVDSAFYLVTEAIVPLLSVEAPDADDREPAVWGLYQTLDALSFLHTSGFTHGLFGPAAIFVTPQGDYRLGSFELCRKGADAASLIAGRRRCGPSVAGWPDAPSYLQEGGAPTAGVDLWGAALMAAYVFGAARSGKRGADFRPDLARATQDLPPELRKPCAEFQRPGPLRGRSPVAELVQSGFFQQHPAVRVMSFLGSLHIKSTEEKDAYFESLPALLDSVPHGMQTRQVLPELLTAQKFPGQEAAQVLPSILKIGVRLGDEEFKQKVAPLVVQLFSSTDRAIRFRLLSSLGDMIDHLDEGMINDKIFPECVNGFTDSNGPIREATVKSLVHFVPRLRVKTVEGRVVNLMVKLLQDPEASIRTNAVICCGRVSSSLPKSCVNQTLTSVLAAGLKDSFGHCRSAALQTLLATAGIFSAEELAGKLMPQVCHRLVDPDAGVSDTAFQVLASLQQHLRQQVEERRAQTSEVPPGVEDTMASTAVQQGGWGSWALSTVGSVVGQKIMGSMAKGGTTPSAATGEAASLSSTSFSSNAPPPQLSAKPSGGSGGRAPVAEQADDAPLGEGWDEEEDFWDNFGEMPPPLPDEPEEEDIAPAKPPPGRGMALGSGAAPAKAAPAATAVGRTGPTRQAAPAPAQAKPKPKAQEKPPDAKPKAIQPGSSEEDDFWKEFDM